jgi:hypothetical protein
MQTAMTFVRLRFQLMSPRDRQDDDAIDPLLRIAHALLQSEDRMARRLRELQAMVTALETENRELKQILEDRGER